MFLEQRKGSAIRQAVGGITDTELREKISGYLRKILGKSETERIAAANELLTMTTGQFEHSHQISAALSRLTGRAGYQDNSLLIMLKTNAAFTVYQTKFGPGATWTC